MRKIVVLMMVVLIGIPSFAQKQKTLKKENVTKENLKPQNRELQRPERKIILTPEQMKEIHERELSRKFSLMEKGLKLEKDAMEKFWNTYIKFDEQKFGINLKQTLLSNDILKKYIDENKEGQGFDVMMLNDEEATILLRQKIEAERQIFEITQKYIDIFKEQLTPQQMLKLKDIEQEAQQRTIRHRANKDAESIPMK